MEKTDYKNPIFLKADVNSRYKLVKLFVADKDDMLDQERAQEGSDVITYKSIDNGMLSIYLFDVVVTSNSGLNQRNISKKEIERREEELRPALRNLMKDIFPNYKETLELYLNMQQHEEIKNAEYAITKKYNKQRLECGLMPEE